MDSLKNGGRSWVSRSSKENGPRRGRKKLRRSPKVGAGLSFFPSILVIDVTAFLVELVLYIHTVGKSLLVEYSEHLLCSGRLAV